MAYYNKAIHVAETYLKIRVQFVNVILRKGIPHTVMNGLYMGYQTIVNQLELLLKSSYLWLARWGDV